MGNALRFKQLSVQRQQGELARLKVVQGPDYGTVFVLVGPKAFIGRGDENDIVLSDLKTSRIHAELGAVGGGWQVKDKGSANGILHNGKATREARLIINDTITLGETTLEFETAEAGTQMLVAPPRSMEQVGVEQQHRLEHQEKLKKMGFSAIFAGAPKTGAEKAKSAESVKKLLILAVVVAGGYLYLGDEEKPKPKAAKKAASVNLASFLPSNSSGRETEMLFKDGLREYFLGNYSRARTQFETVLQISPGHPLATIYLENVTKGVEKEVKIHLDYGRKSYKAGKLKDSKAHFLKVMRLLNRDRTNPNYIEAQEQYERSEKASKGTLTEEEDNKANKPQQQGGNVE